MLLLLKLPLPKRLSKFRIKSLAIIFGSYCGKKLSIQCQERLALLNKGCLKMKISSKFAKIGFGCNYCQLMISVYGIICGSYTTSKSTQEECKSREMLLGSSISCLD
jgi:hypothetical protein